VEELMMVELLLVRVPVTLHTPPCLLLLQLVLLLLALLLILHEVKLDRLRSLLKVLVVLVGVLMLRLLGVLLCLNARLQRFVFDAQPERLVLGAQLLGLRCWRHLGLRDLIVERILVGTGSIHARLGLCWLGVNIKRIEVLLSNSSWCRWRGGSGSAAWWRD